MRYTIVPSAIAPVPAAMLVTLRPNEAFARSFASFDSGGQGAVLHEPRPSAD